MKTDAAVAKFHKAVWLDNLSEETGWWEHVFAGQSEYSEGFLKTLKEDSPFVYIEDAMRFSEKVINVLDLGCGASTRQGTLNDRGKTIQLFAVDPLGDEYRKLYVKNGLKERVPTITLAGEQLMERFDPEFFHIAYSANALDHAYDPLLAIQNTMKCLKPGGVFYLMGAENEGQFNQYQGLHQWNFEERGGDLVIWSPKQGDISLRKELKGCTVKARKAPDFAERWHLTEIRK